MSWPDDSLGHSIAAKLGAFRKAIEEAHAEHEKKAISKKELEDKVNDLTSSTKLKAKEYISQMDKKAEPSTEAGVEDVETNNAVDRASEYFGTSYKKIVCSTLVTKAYPQLTDTLDAQIAESDPVDKQHLQKGDLVFFKYDADKNANHVGIVAGFSGQEVRQTWFLHASTSRGVTLSNLNEPGGRGLGTGKKKTYKPWQTYVTCYRRPRKPN